MVIQKYPVILLVISVMLGVCGQFLFKTGLNKMGAPLELSWRLIRIFFTPYIFGGLSCYVLSTFTWLTALSRVDLSLAYPMLSLGYVLIFIIGIFFLKEEFTLTKLFANLLIVAGIILLNLKLK